MYNDSFTGIWKMQLHVCCIAEPSILCALFFLHACTVCLMHVAWGMSCWTQGLAAKAGQFICQSHLNNSKWLEHVLTMVPAQSRVRLIITSFWWHNLRIASVRLNYWRVAFQEGVDSFHCKDKLYKRHEWLIGGHPHELMHHSSINQMIDHSSSSLQASAWSCSLGTIGCLIAGMQIKSLICGSCDHLLIHTMFFHCM